MGEESAKGAKGAKVKRVIAYLFLFPFYILFIGLTLYAIIQSTLVDLTSNTGLVLITGGIWLVLVIGGILYSTIKHFRKKPSQPTNYFTPEEKEKFKGTLFDPDWDPSKDE